MTRRAGSSLAFQPNSPRCLSLGPSSSPSSSCNNSHCFASFSCSGERRAQNGRRSCGGGGGGKGCSAGCAPAATSLMHCALCTYTAARQSILPFNGFEKNRESVRQKSARLIVLVALHGAKIANDHHQHHRCQQPNDSFGLQRASGRTSNSNDGRPSIWPTMATCVFWPPKVRGELSAGWGLQREKLVFIGQICTPREARQRAC